MSHYNITPEIGAIEGELDYAAEKWGTDFDDKNTLNDWVTYATLYGTDAAKMGNGQDVQYSFLIKAAGLLIIAANRVRRGEVAPRHYEGEPSRGHGRVGTHIRKG